MRYAHGDPLGVARKEPGSIPTGDEAINLVAAFVRAKVQALDYLTERPATVEFDGYYKLKTGLVRQFPSSFVLFVNVWLERGRPGIPIFTGERLPDPKGTLPPLKYAVLPWSRRPNGSPARYPVELVKFISPANVWTLTQRYERMGDIEVLALMGKASSSESPASP